MSHNPVEWVPATCATASSLAHRALVAGREARNGSPLWVIRAHHGGEFIPGKLAIKRRAAYVSFADKEVPVDNFEILCVPEHRVSWVTDMHGDVPPNAIIAGNSRSAEPLYVCRVKHLKSITPGKVHPSHRCAFISYKGIELRYLQYEVLCKAESSVAVPSSKLPSHIEKLVKRRKRRHIIIRRQGKLTRTGDVRDASDGDVTQPGVSTSARAPQITPRSSQPAYGPGPITRSKARKMANARISEFD